MEGLDPPRCYPPVPETGASTNSATSARDKGADFGGGAILLSMKTKQTRTSKQDWRSLAPNHARGPEPHERPTPSRRYILAVLKEKGAPLTLDELCAHFALADED